MELNVIVSDDDSSSCQISRGRFFLLPWVPVLEQYLLVGEDNRLISTNSEFHILSVWWPHGFKLRCSHPIPREIHLDWSCGHLVRIGHVKARCITENLSSVIAFLHWSSIVRRLIHAWRPRDEPKIGYTTYAKD